MARTPPIPPPPPKNHDILPLFLKDPHSVDVCFVFPDDKTFPNHGLWAHRLVLSRNKVFVKMIDDAVQQATVAATQTRLVSSPTTGTITSTITSTAGDLLSKGIGGLSIQEDDNSSATSSSYTDIGGQEGDSGSGTSPKATVATLSDSGDIKNNKQSNNTFVFNFTKSAADINTAKATAFTGFGTGAGAETAAAATRTTFGASWIIGTGPGGSGGFGTGASGGFGLTTSGGFGAGASGGWNTGTWGTLGADTRPTLETSTFGASTLGAPTLGAPSLGASAPGTSTLESVTGSSLGSGLGASTGSSLGAGLGAETGSTTFDSVSPTTTNAGKGPSTLTLTIKKFSLETLCALLQFIYTGDSSCTIQTSQFVLSANSPGLDQPLSRDSASIRWMVDIHQGLQKWVPMVKDEDLMLAAHEYGVSDLAAICQTRVEELMSESNIGHILFEVAPQYSKIKAPALAYVVSNKAVLFAAGKDIFASYRSHPQCHAIMMEIFQLMASSK